MNKTQAGQSALEGLSSLRKKLGRAFLVLIIASVLPLFATALFMSREWPEGSQWVLMIGLSLLAGLLSAWVMGCKLNSKIMAVLRQSVMSESKLRQLMELSGDWYWKQDHEGRIDRIIFRGMELHGTPDKAPLPFVGLTRNEVAGLEPLDRQFTWADFSGLLARRDNFDRLCFDFWPDDRVRLIFESSGRPAYDADGRFCGYEGVSTSITQKWLNEKLLSIQRLFLQGVLLSAPLNELAGSYIRGLKQCLSVHCELMVGFRENDVQPQWMLRSTSKNFRLEEGFGVQVWKDADTVMKSLPGYENSGLIKVRVLPNEMIPESWKSDCRIGCVWLVMKRADEPDQPEYCILIAQKHIAEVQPQDVMRILTALRLLGLCVERRVFEDGLQSLNRTLEDRIAERTAELTATNRELEAFTYTVSHDLRAPLRAIDGFSTILREDYLESLPDDARGLLDRISGNARQMGGLIDGLLDFSRLLRTELTQVEVDLNLMLESVLSQLDARRKAQIVLPVLPTVTADPVLIQQVWMNLIDNALKFSQKTAQPKVEIQALRLEGGWEFSVKDNGAGFDMKYEGKLFKVFERLHHKKDFDGTGVGLAIVKRIVERHGGQIWAQSVPGEGASFTFTIMNCQSQRSDCN